MSRLTWERCDCVSCKKEPVAYIKIRGKSIFNKDKWWLWIRVCEKELKAEMKDPLMEVVKIRKGFAKQVHALLEQRTKEANGQLREKSD